MNENIKEYGKATQFRSGYEAALNGQKGGKASGRKRALKSIAKRVLNQIPPDKIKKQLEKAGYSASDIEEAIMYIFAIKAMNGSEKAWDRLIQAAGKDIKHEELELKRREIELKEKAAAGAERNNLAALARIDEAISKMTGGDE